MSDREGKKYAILHIELHFRVSEDEDAQRSLIYMGQKPLRINVSKLVDQLLPGDRFDPDDYSEAIHDALMNELDGRNFVLSSRSELGRREECPTCEGKASRECPTCEDSGWIIRWGNDRIEPNIDD